MQNLEKAAAEAAETKKKTLAGDLHDSEWQDDWSEEESNEEVGAQFCVFKSGFTYYAIPLDMVREVVKERFVTPVPHLPEHIKGMTNVRGDICAVFDLSVFLGEQQDEPDEYGYFVVLNHEEVSVAIGVSNVPDTIRILESDIKPLANLTKEVKRPDYLGGVINRSDKMIISLKIEDIIESEEFSSSSEIIA